MGERWNQIPAPRASDSTDGFLPTASAAGAALAPLTGSSSCFRPRRPPAPSYLTQISDFACPQQPCHIAAQNPVSQSQILRGSNLRHFILPGSSSETDFRGPLEIESTKHHGVQWQCEQPSQWSGSPAVSAQHATPVRGCAGPRRRRARWRAAAQCLLCSTLGTADLIADITPSDSSNRLLAPNLCMLYAKQR